MESDSTLPKIEYTYHLFNENDFMFSSSATTTESVYQDDDSPLHQINEESIAQDIEKNKESLKRKLQQRRSMKQLADIGIMPPPKAPPPFYEQRKKLQMRKTQDILKNKIVTRPDRQLLIEHNILSDTNVAPAIQNKQRQLKRAKLADDLNDKLAQRPGPLDLIENNILQFDNTNIKQAIQGGLIKFPKSTNVHFSKNPYSFDETIFNISPGTILTTVYTSSSPSSTSSGFEEQTSFSDSSSSSCSSTVSYQTIKTSKLPSKRAQKGNLIFHEYKGPSQKAEITKLPPAPSLPAVALPTVIPTEETANGDHYKIRLQQQQLFLDLIDVPDTKPSIDDPIVSLLQQPIHSSLLPPTTINVSALASTLAPSPSPPLSVQNDGLDEMKLIDLRNECKKLNITTSGNKTQLITKIKNAINKKAIDISNSCIAFDPTLHSSVNPVTASDIANPIQRSVTSFSFQPSQQTCVISPNPVNHASTAIPLTIRPTIKSQTITIPLETIEQQQQQQLQQQQQRLKKDNSSVNLLCMYSLFPLYPCLLFSFLCVVSTSLLSHEELYLQQQQKITELENELQKLKKLDQTQQQQEQVTANVMNLHQQYVQVPIQQPTPKCSPILSVQIQKRILMQQQERLKQKLEANQTKQSVHLLPINQTNNHQITLSTELMAALVAANNNNIQTINATKPTLITQTSTPTYKKVAAIKVKHERRKTIPNLKSNDTKIFPHSFEETLTSKQTDTPQFEQKNIIFDSASFWSSNNVSAVNPIQDSTFFLQQNGTKIENNQTEIEDDILNLLNDYRETSIHSMSPDTSPPSSFTNPIVVTNSSSSLPSISSFIPINSSSSLTLPTPFYDTYTSSSNDMEWLSPITNDQEQNIQTDFSEFLDQFDNNTNNVFEPSANNYFEQCDQTEYFSSNNCSTIPQIDFLSSSMT
ncbi:unnamed protein product [Didymodactylos carnosus]|uniref:SAP domain-containing protein n=1 Tax=Didymodactylos carnosus TaxID=1234261 RepID=A0A814EXL6_9BILA|nr:unnamed protein product [Didymodactylos carnosus]CAF0978215.1 unnamed protein product [Didymodactylos carnosus]CAF3530786.1 unnamed protein product [Didymodactylos carnosus]CAF3751013.1 unnamed protein product [Didymodactylos carnosus]